MEYMVVRATKRPLDKVEVDNHDVAISKKSGSATITDAGLAREIDSRFGRDGEVVKGEVVVVPVHSSDRKLSFTVPALPWKDKK